MDRRTEKTRAAIVNAYKQLLGKPGTTVTVQKIIDLANIGRSTFYSHFADKSSLPREIFEALLYHIGEETPIYPPDAVRLLDVQAEPNEITPTPKARMERLFTHLLKHLEREKLIYSRLFYHEGYNWFLYDFQNALENFMRKYILNVLVFAPEGTPEDLYLQYLIEGFLTTVNWCFGHKNRTLPELARAYVCLVM